MKPILISIVSPVFKAEKILEILVSTIENSLVTITDQYEIILVEDGSPDGSWAKMEELAAANTKIRLIKLSRNFGQHNAITAGLDCCQGEWVVVMDCDMQDRPEEIPHLYQKAVEGNYDIVFARREFRQDHFIKKITSKIFYWAFSYLSGIQRDNTIANFGIYNRKVICSINQIREPMRAFSPMIQWVGFSKTAINVQHGQRHSGNSSYNWSKLISLALDISISYSYKPLKIIMKVGFIISLLSFLYSIFILLKYITGGINVSGYTSIIVAICFFSGLIISFLGVIGLYLSKIFDGVRNRPLYIVDKKINF